MEVLEYIQSIGSVLGLPAALWMAKQYWDLRATIKRVDKMESQNTQLQAELTAIGKDVSFIRGRLEGKL